jgi:hypothetical protein
MYRCTSSTIHAVLKRNYREHTHSAVNSIILETEINLLIQILNIQIKITEQENDKIPLTIHAQTLYKQNTQEF